MIFVQKHFKIINIIFYIMYIIGHTFYNFKPQYKYIGLEQNDKMQQL